jgi:preprotein translocase subunit SecE
VAKAQVAARKQPIGVVRWARETLAELRKVNWPTRQEATQLTGIVLLVVAFTSAVLGFLDFVFARLFALIIGVG